LQTPPGYDRIEAQDNRRSEDTQITYEPPVTVGRNGIVGPEGIRLTMPANDKLTDHAGYAEQQDAAEIQEDKSRTAILTRHKREPPHIAQPYRRARRGQDDSHSAETTSFHLLFSHLFGFKATKLHKVRGRTQFLIVNLIKIFKKSSVFRSKAFHSALQAFCPAPYARVCPLTT
jgi:hypothetical protein